MIIYPNDKRLAYIGRIEDENSARPVLRFAGSGLRFKYKGKKLLLSIINLRQYWNSFLGVLVGGKMLSIPIQDGESTVEIHVNSTEPIDVTIYKRMDDCHAVTVISLETVNGELFKADCPSNRRIEVYGDSVSTGEVSELIDHVGMSDPEHDGRYSNSYFSYAAIAARMLNAEIHNVSTGGIALLDGTGWFPIGMLSCFDKTGSNPANGELKPWDLSRFVPQVIVVAIGQNDARPDNCMKADFLGERAVFWRKEYARFISLLREKRPNAHIILATTILNHDPSWDRAIELVTRDMREKDKKIHHLLYRRNAVGTPGHARIPEAEEMARELCEYINSLGDIWA